VIRRSGPLENACFPAFRTLAPGGSEDTHPIEFLGVGNGSACRLGSLCYKSGCFVSSGLTDDDIEAAKALLANPDIGVTQIAHRLGVSPATLYRYIPAARTANTPDG
jgi:hypothetical protein